MASNGKTSPKVAKAASKVLKDGRTSKTSKAGAGSLLSQAGAQEQEEVMPILDRSFRGGRSEVLTP